MTTHTPPRLTYCGLTVLLANPGRHDKNYLIGGSSEYVLRDAIRESSVHVANRYQLDIRTPSVSASLLPGTKVVLLCGGGAMATLGLSPASLHTLRGSPHKRNGVVYIPTFHPQDCADRRNYEARLNPLHNTGDSGVDEDEDDRDTETDTDTKNFGQTARRNFRFWFIQDFAKAARIAHEGLHTNVATYRINMGVSEILTALRAVPTGAPLYLDIETDPATCQMTCFAFSTGPDVIYSVPVYTYGGSRTRELMWDRATLGAILRELALAMSRTTVVAHNAMFDLFILLWRYRIPPPPQAQIYDTMIAHHRIYVDTEKSLGHCTALYTDQPYHKDEGVFLPTNYEQFRQLLQYNCKDVEVTALIHQKQSQLSSGDEGLRKSILQGNALIRPMLLKSYRGLPTDGSRLCQLVDENRECAAFFEGRVLSRLAGHSVNPRSTKQVSTLLYQELQLPRSSDPTISETGKDALYRLALKFPLPIIKVILKIRQLTKEASQVSCRLWGPKQRVTCSYKIAGPKTLRLASAKLLGSKGWGTNVQNWNKHTRRIIAVPDSREFEMGQVDQSGAEALIVAYLCPDGPFRHLFTYGIKPHTYVAMHLFPQVWRAELGQDISDVLMTPIPQLKQHKLWSELNRVIKATDDNPPTTRYYYFGKQTCHSANYGIGAQRFVRNILEKSEGQISLPLREGQRFLDTYHRLFPEIQTGFQAYVRTQVQTHRLLRNLFGYPFRFWGWMDDPTALKDAYSRIPQSTVGIITAIADSSLQTRIDSGALQDIAILQNNHDSLLFWCPRGMAMEKGRIVQEAMNQEMVNPWGERFRMKSGLSIGDNWYEMKEVA